MKRQIIGGVLAIAVIVSPAFVGTDDQAAPVTFEPCTAEDDQGPCHWSANDQGNGEGNSFTVLGTSDGGTYVVIYTSGTVLPTVYVDQDGKAPSDTVNGYTVPTEINVGK